MIRTRKTRIVCVDDSPDTRALFTLLLGDNAEFEIVDCLSNTSLLERCIAAKRPDVVVLDFWMPGQEPVEVMRRAKASFPDVRFLVLSSDDDAAQVDLSFAGGATGYAIKDGNFERLASAIRKVAAGETVRPLGGARNRSA